MKQLSQKTINFLLKMQQNEITEHLVYTNLAKRVKKEEDKKILLEIADAELKHSILLEGYTKKKLKPKKIKVFIYKILSLIFGYTFVIKIMEYGEKNAQEGYANIVYEVPDATKIAKEEDEHEDKLIAILDEERLKYIGSMVLGLSDALVEISGTLAGLTFALQNNKLVALSGIITGISANLSMASSEYLSAKAEGNEKSALKSSAYTGIMYLITVSLLILPYLIFSSYIYALLFMLLVVVLTIFFFTFYISVSKSLPFKQRFMEMAGISLTVASISFFVGILVKHFLGIDI